MTARPTVLVLGASGRLGRMLQKAWSDDPSFAVHWQSRSGDGGIDPLTNSKGLARLCSEADVVLNLAGPTGGDATVHEVHPRLARAILEAGGRHVLLMSSAAVYGQQMGPLSENALLQPLSPYARAKVEMEKVSQNATVLRLGNVAGADALLGGTTPGRPIFLDQFPDGRTPSRSYIGPDSFARVLRALCLCLIRGDDVPSPLNIAAPRPVQMGALLDAAGLSWRPRPVPPSASPEVWLDTTALQRMVPLASDADTPEQLVAEWRQILA